MGRTGAESVTLYNASNETEYIQLKNVSQDSEYLNEGVAEEDLDGNLLYVEDRAFLLLRFYDQISVELIRTWMLSGTMVKAVVFGKEDYIIWNTPSKIRFSQSNNFALRKINKSEIELRSKGSDLDINKTFGYLLTAEGKPLNNFIGFETDDGVGIKAQSIPPAAIVGSGSISWFGQTMETVIIETN